MATLTQGCVSQMFRDGKPKQPLVQLIEMKMAATADSSAAKRVK